MMKKSIFKSKVFWAQVAIIAGAAYTFFTTEDAATKNACIAAAIIAIGTIIARFTSSGKKLYITGE